LAIVSFQVRLCVAGLLLAALAEAQSHTAPPFVDLYREALERRQKQFGPAHPKVAESLTNLALLLQNSGDSVSAEPLLRRALTIDEKAFGAQDARLATDLVHLGAVLEARRHPRAAEPVYRRALALKEQALGRDHSDVAEIAVKLAAALETAGNNRSANSESPKSRRLSHAANATSGGWST